jgi:D-tagatose-1,6-bisphosphate aldolase subunit GatZ/KbaZ
VGPALTFAMRECLVNLALIEDELIDSQQRSCLMGVLDRAMTNDHRYWEHHYRGAPDVVRLQRIYSYSDRVRYYWNHPEVKAAIGTLMSNLRSVQIPETLISNFLPDQYTALRARELVADAQALVIHRVRRVLGAYSAACNVRDAAA